MNRRLKILSDIFMFLYSYINEDYTKNYMCNRRAPELNRMMVLSFELKYSLYRTSTVLKFRKIRVPTIEQYLSTRYTQVEAK